MDQLAMAALYVATYRAAAFRHFKETPRFFGFLNSKLGDNVFEWHSKGKWYAYAQCFDDRLKSTITSTNSRVDWLTAKYHKVFRKLVLKEGWDVEEALYEAMKITNFAVKYFKQFKQYEKNKEI